MTIMGKKNTSEFNQPDEHEFVDNGDKSTVDDKRVGGDYQDPPHDDGTPPTDEDPNGGVSEYKAGTETEYGPHGDGVIGLPGVDDPSGHIDDPLEAPEGLRDDQVQRADGSGTTPETDDTFHAPDFDKYVEEGR